MKRLVFALLLLTCSASPSWAGLTLSIHDGLVTMDAQDVTLRQILTEWARIGKTQIVNVERVTGGPITVKLEGVPEKQALDIVLRSIPGYMALPRVTQVADASLYDRILIMPTTTAVAALRPQQPPPGFPGMQGMQGMISNGPGATLTQLRPNVPLSPGMLPDSPNEPDKDDDPAMAAAAAAGLVPMSPNSPGPASFMNPLMPPNALMPPAGAQPGPASATPGVGTPTNPWNIPAATAQPTLAPPTTGQQAPPTLRQRMPPADR